MEITVHTSDLLQFQKTVQSYYNEHGRHDMLWRRPEPDGGYNPYKIMVSEIMLQQTQVARVTVKYVEFLRLFPSVWVLAAAPLAGVLSAWNGLGYNRRAKFLWQAAQMIVSDYNAVFPTTIEELVQLPGIGPNTAGAILAYAYNQPVVFIETNIRTVYIYHFFADITDVPDAKLRGLIERTLDTENPRLWYWALMDYGAFLKQTVGNKSRASKSYTKQSTFNGSLRQIRGQVLRLLMEKPLTSIALAQEIQDARLATILDGLEAEQLIGMQGNTYHLG